MKKVIVLMSTYNGEKYIREQLDSIINQKGINLKILVRDDGSNDSTISILKEYEEKCNLEWFKGKNLKPARSFIELLKKADDADYYAFSDQDDFWLEDKLISAIEKLEKSKEQNGKLYFSALNVVDEKLNSLYKEEIDRDLDFKAEMIKNYATGCTMVFDNNLRKIVNENNYEYIEMHDSLMCKIAYLNDSYVYIDNNSYILYRQHGNNVLGMSNNPLKVWKRRWKRFLNSNCEASETAKQLLKVSNLKMSYEKRYFLELLSNYKKKLKYKKELLKIDVFNNSKLMKILYRVKLLFNKV